MLRQTRLYEENWKMMQNIIIANIVVVSAIAAAAAAILYFIAQKFKVEKNIRAEEIEQILPQANCGACGKAGCQAFAAACADADAATFATLYCPVGGAKVMSAIAEKLGYEVAERQPTAAVLRCNGTCENAPDKVEYIGLKSCRLASRVFVGKTGCPNGCLRFGDCVRNCPFGAISMNETTGMPEVDVDKCTSCGKCVRVCPRGLFEIRPLAEKGVQLYVACRNRQKGAIARKNCKAACIACMKCSKICPEVIVEDNLSYIPSTVDPAQYGEELSKACPTGAIIYRSNRDE